MKVNRQSDQKEKYNITSSWMYEFAHDLEKNAQNVDYLRQYLDSRVKKKVFNTIDEKLADIKDRVGFDLARKISEETSKDFKVESSKKDCDCNSCGCQVKEAQDKSSHSEKDLGLMSNILKYIQDMIKHEPYLDAATVIARCRKEDGLGFGQLRIDLSKLRTFIDAELKNHEEKISPIFYVPSSTMNDGEAENLEAEYFNHALPKKS